MPRDLTWYVTLAVLGVILGSLASFGFRGGFFRNVIIGVFAALGLGLALEAAGIHLPFEPWLKAVVNDTFGIIGRFFEQLVRVG